MLHSCLVILRLQLDSDSTGTKGLQDSAGRHSGVQSLEATDDWGPHNGEHYGQ